jgi:hypothetical protein
MRAGSHIFSLAVQTVAVNVIHLKTCWWIENKSVKRNVLPLSVYLYVPASVLGSVIR